MDVPRSTPADATQPLPSATTDGAPPAAGGPAAPDGASAGRLGPVPTAELRRRVQAAVRRRMAAAHGPERHAAGLLLRQLLAEWDRRGTCPRPVGRTPTE